MSSKDKIRKLRLSEKNNISNQLKTLQSYIKRKKETISRMRKNTPEMTNFIMKKISKIESEIYSHNEEIDELTNRIKQLQDGLLDDELLNVFKKNSNRQEEIALKKKEKKRLIDEDKKERKDRSQHFYTDQRDADRKFRRMKREYNKSNHYFNNVIDTLPDYMKANLKKMPNNRGYAWRGVYFYGDLPDEENGLSVITERKKGKNLSHEWKDGIYRKYLVEKINIPEKKNSRNRNRRNNNKPRYKKEKILLEETKTKIKR